VSRREVVEPIDKFFSRCFPRNSGANGNVLAVITRITQGVAFVARHLIAKG